MLVEGPLKALAVNTTIALPPIQASTQMPKHTQKITLPRRRAPDAIARHCNRISLRAITDMASLSISPGAGSNGARVKGRPYALGAGRTPEHPPSIYGTLTLRDDGASDACGM